MAKKIKAVSVAPQVEEFEADSSLETGADDALSLPDESQYHAEEESTEVENDLPEGGAIRVTNIGHLKQRSRMLGIDDERQEHVFDQRIAKKIAVEKLKQGDVSHLIADDHLKVEHVTDDGQVATLSRGGQKQGTLPAKIKAA